MSNTDDRLAALTRQFERDDEAYARVCLRVRPKDPRLGNQPFLWNRAQRYIHAKLEEQKRITGKVRALVLKGRQQGVSTYIGGRFYKRVTFLHGVRCFILTHEQDATNNLFAMVDRYHSHNPPEFKPSTGAANAKELVFDLLESGYAVGTAGTKAVGRSQTIQYFHGSEVAFWPNAPTHFAGVVQAVPDMPGTEIILESTANGVGGEFHERWQQAERGESDYIAIFVPWFWQEEYSRTPPAGFVLSEEEQEYLEAFKLTPAQMCWRRAKIAELKDPMLFKQEYPATAAEAFQMSGHDSFIPTDIVLRARKHTIEKPSGPKVWGYDPNWSVNGKDRATLAKRQGRKVYSIQSHGGKAVAGVANLPAMRTNEQVGWLKRQLDEEKPDRLFIDAGGAGIAIYDRLVEMGYGDVVRLIDFGGKPFEPNPVDPMTGEVKGGYKNRRAEMWGNSRDWLDDEGGADIPDRDALHADACAPGSKYDSNTLIQLESKEAMAVRGVRSPDEWDAVALTFAEPVAPKMASGPKKRVRLGTMA